MKEAMTLPALSGHRLSADLVPEFHLTMHSPAAFSVLLSKLRTKL
jgi:hypothetical protein